jgi:hypothetical protein
LVKDYPKAAALAQVLKDLEFPADKKQIVDYVERARPQSEEILPDIQKIEDRRFENVSDVTRAAGLAGSNNGSRCLKKISCFFLSSAITGCFAMVDI